MCVLRCGQKNFVGRDSAVPFNIAELCHFPLDEKIQSTVHYLDFVLVISKYIHVKNKPPVILKKMLASRIFGSIKRPSVFGRPRPHTVTRLKVVYFHF